MWPPVLTDSPPHHEARVGACVSRVNAHRKKTLTRFTPYTCTSITCIQTEPTLITEDNGAPFHSPVSVASDIEREKSDKFCSEALISAWGSFTCRKSTTRDPRLYFPSEGSHTQDIFALKKIHRPRPGSNPRTSDPEAMAHLSRGSILLSRVKYCIYSIWTVTLTDFQICYDKLKRDPSYLGYLNLVRIKINWLPFFLISCAWQCRGVSDSLASGIHDLSPAASRLFPKVLGDTAGAPCAQISSLDAFRAATAVRTISQSWYASVLCGRPEPGLRVWECSTDHYWKQWQTTNTLWPTSAAIHRYVHPASRRPTIQPCSNGWSCSTGVRTHQQGKIVPSSECCKHCSSLKAPQLLPADQNTGCKDRPPERQWLINESLTLQPFSMQVLHHGANGHSLWRVAFFWQRTYMRYTLYI